VEFIDMKVPQGKVKSPSIPLYKRGKILKWFQQVPPFHKGKSNSLPPFSKGGLGGISSQEGYTLVEILIAIAILAFGLMAVATMQITAIKTNAIASGISQGLTLGQTKVEELMNLSYNHLELLDTDGDGTGQDLDDDGVDDDGDNFGLDDTTGADGSAANGRYTTYWNIAVDEPVISSKTIRVIVTWTEKGRNKRINLDFVKTNLS
jgi:prepilin-type N-terminal cleavage/methylation domain-containing protein